MAQACLSYCNLVRFDVEKFKIFFFKLIVLRGPGLNGRIVLKLIVIIFVYKSDILSLHAFILNYNFLN